MKPKIIEQFPEWVKIPSQMQYQFFELAEKQAKQIKAKLLRDKEKLNNLCRLLKFETIRRMTNGRIGG